MIFIVYQPDGQGCFIEVGSFSDRQLAIDNTPPGGHVEILTADGSITVYTKPA